SAITASAPGVTSGTVSFNAMATEPTSIMFATHVKPILDANCISCHKIGGAAAFSPLTDYSVVRYGMAGQSNRAYVIPGDAAASLLVEKISATGTMYAMLGGDAATQDANLKTITSWI